ncbi:MAG: hypothetical protein ACE5GL_00105 [Calditrichia bacterium]
MAEVAGLKRKYGTKKENGKIKAWPEGVPPGGKSSELGWFDFAHHKFWIEGGWCNAQKNPSLYFEW